jgi:YVTN family beta-propeller protein
MPRFARDIQNSNRSKLVQRRLPSRWIKDRAAQLLLALVAVFSISLQAFAQSPTPGCLPYSTNYPCIYVADMGVANPSTPSIASTVPVLNATTNTLIGTISDSQLMAAFAVAVTPNNAFAWVSMPNGIAVIDTSTNKQIITISLPSHPSQVTFSQDGAFAWVAERGFGYSTPAVEAITTTVTPDGTPPVIHTVKPETNTQPIPVLTNPTAITLSLDGTIAYAADSCGNYACIDVIDTSTYTLTKQVILTTPTFNNASIAITPDGSLLCVSLQVPSTSTSSPTMYGVAFLHISDDMH